MINRIAHLLILLVIVRAPDRSLRPPRTRALRFGLRFQMSLNAARQRRAGDAFCSAVG